jgi:hypothetical protein
LQEVAWFLVPPLLAVLAWVWWLTFVVEPREFRERFRTNRAKSLLSAKPHDPSTLWPEVRQWFALNFDDVEPGGY